MMNVERHKEIVVVGSCSEWWDCSKCC